MESADSLNTHISVSLMLSPFIHVYLLVEFQTVVVVVVFLRLIYSYNSTTIYHLSQSYVWKHIIAVVKLFPNVGCPT